MSKNGSITIAIHKKDEFCLENLKNIVCKDLPIKFKATNMVTLTINSKTMVNDICMWLNIVPKKKSHVVCFPKLKDDKLKWTFLRGLFDGDGSIRNILEQDRGPECKITSSSENMRNYIKEFSKIPCNEYGIDLVWNNNNCLDFLGKLYENSSSSTRLLRKYEMFLDISTWVPSVSWSRYFINEHCTWTKTRKDAINPSKTRISDSGYDLTLLEKIKTIGNVEMYDTGIKIRPNFGYYFILVPRSSIIKSGYILANSIGIIDRTYLGNILVPLIKIDTNAPDLELPNKIVQLIPTQIMHFQLVEVEKFDENDTNRSIGGFGSTNK